MKRQRVRIRIKNTQRKIAINKKTISKQADQILKIKGINKAELSILFVGKRFMRTLNRRFRKTDRPTDVLAFSMREEKATAPHPAIYPQAKSIKINKESCFGQEILGDIVICPEVAQRFAKIYNTTQEEEICLDLIHGILHLLGREDSSAKGRSFMTKEQARILKKISK